jgi:hypothetical protein
VLDHADSRSSFCVRNPNRSARAIDAAFSSAAFQNGRKPGRSQNRSVQAIAVANPQPRCVGEVDKLDKVMITADSNAGGLPDILLRLEVGCSRGK